MLQSLKTYTWGVLLLIFFVVPTHATNFTTTTITGTTLTGTYEETTYHLNWYMRWFDQYGAPQNFFSLQDTIRDGIAYMPRTLFGSPSTVYTTYLGMDLPDILDADDIYLSVMGKNSYASGAVPARDFHLVLIGTEGKAEVNYLDNVLLAKYAKLAAGDTVLVRDGYLIHGFDNWTQIGLKIQNNTVYAYVNGQPVKLLNFGGSLGKLVNIGIDFRGSAAIDTLAIYEGGVEKMRETFNVTGTTTAKLVVYSGSLFPQGMTGTVTSGAVITGTVTVQAPDYNHSPYANELLGEYTPDQIEAFRRAALLKAQRDQALACKKMEQVIPTLNILDTTRQPLINKYVSACNQAFVSAIRWEDKADPIDLSNGSMTYSQTLMSLPGKGMPFDFSLRYESSIAHDSTVGYGFDHNWNIFLGYDEDDGKLYYNDGRGYPILMPEDTQAPGTWYQEQLGARVVMNTARDFELHFNDGSEILFRKISTLDWTIYRPVAVVDAAGNVISMVWNDDNQLERVIDTAGRVINFAYNADGKIIQVQEGSKTVELSYYQAGDAQGTGNDLKKITVRHGNEVKTTEFTYSVGYSQEHLNHNMLTVVDSKGQNYVTNTYSTDDTVSQQVYGGDNYEYTYTRNAQGAITQVDVVNGRGKETRYRFNNQGNVIERRRTTDAGGFETYTMQYNTVGQITSYVYPNGKRLEYTYDSLQRLASQTVSDASNALSQTTQYSYEGNTPWLSSLQLPNGQVIENDYNAGGFLVTSTARNVNKGDTTVNLVTSYEYNADGQVSRITDPQGVITVFGYDNYGNLDTITKGPDTVHVGYDSNGYITDLTDGEGKTVTINNNAFGQGLQYTTAEGIVQTHNFDSTNNLTDSHVSLGGTSSADSTMTYDVLDRLVGMNVKQSATTTQQYTWTYNPHDLINRMTAPNGSTISYEYDHNDAVISQTISSGSISKVYEYEYNNNGELVKVTAPNGAQTTWTRDGLGRVIEMVDALGTKTMISYNSQNLPLQVKIKDTNNTTIKKTEYSYNGLGWKLSEQAYTQQGTQRIAGATQSPSYTQAQSQVYTTHYVYNRNGQVQTVTDPKGNSTSMTYDTKGRLRQVTDAMNNRMIYSYDGRDLVLKKRLISGSNGTIYDTQYSYDDDGRLVLVTNNDGKHKGFVYNTLNQVTRVRDENGNRTDMTYDYLGNMLTQTQYLQGNGNAPATSVTTSYEYDIMNNLISMTDAEGNTSRFVYDGLGRMIEEIYPDGKKNRYSYDVMDNVTQTIDPNGNVVSNDYDILNRLVERNIVRGAGIGGVTRENYSYDAVGRLIGGYDNLNQAISFDYDGLDRVTRERNGGKYLHYEYDANSNLSTVIYPSTKQVSRDFDALDRLTTMDWSAYGQTINLMDNDYDSLFLLQTSFGNQAKTTYSYDNLMRTSSIDHYQSLHPMHSNAGQVIEALDYNYDDVSNVLSDGYRDYTLDSLYRVTNALYPPNQAEAIKKEKFGYDKVGNRTQFESWVEKAHGNNASLINNQTTVASTANNPLVLQQMMVAANGNSKITVCHNGASLEINSSALSSHLAHGDLQGACIGSTTGSNNSGNTGNGNGSGSSNGNVGSGSSTSSGSTTSGTAQPGGPTYGGAGGTPGMLTFQGTTTYNVNNLNQYTDMTYPRNGSQTETVGLEYDNNGNLTQDDKRAYEYDYRNRLIQATHLQNGEVITFKYDILNRRTQKTDRSKSWKWIYTFHDVAEEDWFMNGSMSAGAIKVREFVYGNGLDDLVYMEQNKPLTYQDEQEEEGYTEVYTGGGFNTAVKRYFFQKDLAGSTKIVSDIQGKVIEMYAYDSFGRIYERNGISGNYRPFQTSRINHNRFFTGREYDADLQQYYYRARWYSPALGRFTSRDPIGYAGGVNLYRYVNNNPTTFTDPWGLKEKKIIQYANFDAVKIQDRRQYFDAGRTPMGALNAVGNIGVFAKNAGRSIWNGGIDTAAYLADTTLRGYNEGVGVAAGKVGSDAYLIGNTVYNGVVNTTWEQKKDFAYQTLTNIETYENLAGALLTTKGLSSVSKVGSVTKSTNSVITKTSFFEGTYYSNKVLNIDMPKGDFHSFPEAVRSFESDGIVSKVVGGDGITREILRIAGSYGGKDGVFEFMKEPDGKINHRFFNANPK